MAEEADHGAHVGDWLGGAAKGLAPAEVVALLERALGALWRRSEVTLGEVTLMAIVDRVLFTASEKYAFLSTLKVERTGIGFDEFHAQGTRDGSVAEALRLVLVEFLTVLGHLTNEIMTPALHAELSRVTLGGVSAPGSNDDGPQGAPS